MNGPLDTDELKMALPARKVSGAETGPRKEKDLAPVVQRLDI